MLALTTARIMTIVLIVTNFLNYVDRGIVPGAANYFTAFISGSWTPGNAGPSLYFGALQSAFIVGFSFGSVAVGSLVHRQPPFKLSAFGLVAWCLAATAAGLSKYANSYVLLLFARACSGLGEAGFITIGGPYIQDTAGDAQGLWLGLFFAMIPTGTAVGYGYGTLVAGSLTWSWAFFIEAIAMLPLVFCYYFSSDDGSKPFKQSAADSPTSALEDEDDDDDRVDLRRLRGALGFSEDEISVVEKPPPTFFDEISLCLSQPCFVWVALGYAGYAGSVLGYSTFAPSIVVGLGLWSTMTEASVDFSVTIALSGIVGTPLGGYLLDKWTERRRPSGATNINAALEASIFMISLGALFVAYAAVAFDKVSFLARLFLGTLPLFAATTPMNVALYESVPKQNRALGTALGVLIMHAFGDVPTPILCGAAKDALAPACAPSGKHDRLGEKCPQQRTNLRLVALACALWLFWSILGFSIAYVKSRRIARKERRVLRQRVDGDLEQDEDAHFVSLPDGEVTTTENPLTQFTRQDSS